MIRTEDFRVQPGTKPNLSKIPSLQTGDLDKSDAKDAFNQIADRLDELQKTMFAEGKHAVLIVLQALDAGGKDSTIRSIFGAINPQGCRVTGFKKPTDLELAHDFLWRIHAAVPAKGMIGVFNRSHYESVLIERVKNLVPKSIWRGRYDHINHFEKLLADEGVTIRKFYLHISKDYQKQQFQDRLDEPAKHWKFNPADLTERALWDDYRAAFEDALGKCSTDHAPWYIIPAEKKWFRNLLVGKVILETLESLDMKYPEPDFDPAEITIE